MSDKRFLSPKLKEFLDEELSLVIVNAQTCFLEAAQMCVGIEEEGGDNRGPMVEAFQATIGGVSGESWCLSFIQSLFAYVEDRFHVRVNLPLTEHCLTLWDKADKKYKVSKGKDPQAGDIVIFQYGDSQKGHAEIVTKFSKSCPMVMEVIGGNTAQHRAVIREGQGVWQNIRSVKGTTNMHVVGFIRPEYTLLEGGKYDERNRPRNRAGLQKG